VLGLREVAFTGHGGTVKEEHGKQSIVGQLKWVSYKSREGGKFGG